MAPTTAASSSPSSSLPPRSGVERALVCEAARPVEPAATVAVDQRRAHGIEQLRQEITRIQSDLTGWHTTKRAADAEVEAAKAELMQAQENKRRLSERLFEEAKRELERDR